MYDCIYIIYEFLYDYICVTIYMILKMIIYMNIYIYYDYVCVTNGPTCGLVPKRGTNIMSSKYL